MVDTQPLPPTAIRIPLLASTMAFAAGLVWSLGALMARLADDTDAWQYLIWRSIGILIVMELLTRARRRPPLLPIAYTSGRLMLLACGALLLASVAFVYAVEEHHRCERGLPRVGDAVDRGRAGAGVHRRAADTGDDRGDRARVRRPARHGHGRSRRREHGRQHRRALLVARVRRLHRVHPVGSAIAIGHRSCRATRR